MRHLEGLHQANRKSYKTGIIEASSINQVQIFGSRVERPKWVLPKRIYETATLATVPRRVDSVSRAQP
jgi:hypothetical protein